MLQKLQEQFESHEIKMIGKYVPMLSNPDILNKIKSLDIQDICAICHGANKALEEGTLANVCPKATSDDILQTEEFVKNTNALTDLIHERLFRLKQIWIMGCTTTSSPFLTGNGTLFIYTDKKYADAQLQQMEQAGYQCFNMAPVPQKGIETFLKYAYQFWGVNQFELNSSAYVHFTVVPRWARDEGSEDATKNPELFSTITKFQQQRFCNIYEGDRDTQDRECENKLIKQLSQSSLIVPYKESDDGEITYPEIKVQVNGDEHIAMPLFTDAASCDLICPAAEWTSEPAEFSNLLDLSNVTADYLILNPQNLRFLMDIPMLEQIRDILENGELEADDAPTVIVPTLDNPDVGDEEEDVVPTTSVHLMSTFNVNKMFKDNATDGEKAPHRTSPPMIFIKDGTAYLAAFTFFYTAEDIKSGMVNRPTSIMLADLMTGKFIGSYSTKELEFSDAPYDQQYSIRMKKKGDVSKEYYKEAFAMLDEIRSDFIEFGVISGALYKKYLGMLLANIPDDYQRFYRDLSNCLDSEPSQAAPAANVEAASEPAQDADVDQEVDDINEPAEFEDEPADEENPAEIETDNTDSADAQEDEADTYDWTPNDHEPADTEVASESDAEPVVQHENDTQTAASNEDDADDAFSWTPNDQDKSQPEESTDDSDELEFEAETEDDEDDTAKDLFDDDQVQADQPAQDESVADDLFANDDTQEESAEDLFEDDGNDTAVKNDEEDDDLFAAPKANPVQSESSSSLFDDDQEDEPDDELDDDDESAPSPLNTAQNDEDDEDDEADPLFFDENAAASDTDDNDASAPAETASVADTTEDNADTDDDNDNDEGDDLFQDDTETPEEVQDSPTVLAITKRTIEMIDAKASDADSTRLDQLINYLLRADGPAKKFSAQDRNRANELVHQHYGV